MRLDFEGLWGCNSVCHIENHGNVVIATELPENNGTSITNFAEHLAKMSCDYYNIEYDSLIWIEHYPEETYGGRHRESFDKVTFEISEKGFSNPSWKRITKKDVQDLINFVG